MRAVLNHIILAVFSLGVTACNNETPHTIDQKKIITTDTTLPSPYKQQSSNDTAAENPTILPVESQFQTKVLTTGTFHKNEVWRNAEKQKWYGLFKTADGFYLEQTQLKTQRVHDPVLDGNENEKTGWKISTVQKDSNYILIHALPYLQNRKVQHVGLNKKYMYPGDKLNFSFLGTNYTLFATSVKNKEREDATAGVVRNYKLYMTATKAGQQITQLLVAQPSFDDKMIQLLFAGDIDGDGFLDLIIDTSSHYNARSPTIYLSKPADNQELLKPVGGHTSVGG